MSPIAPREARLVSWLAPWIPAGATVLDVGAGSGLVAEAVADMLRARMTLVDVVDNNRSRFPLRRYDGRTYDVALLAFVLHHSQDARRTLQEARRVASRLVILEDTHRSTLEHLAGRWTDWILNRGYHVAPACAQMRPEEWRAFIEQESLRIVHVEGSRRSGSAATATRSATYSWRT